MNIGIIRTAVKADRFKLKEHIEETGVQVLHTIDQATNPPSLIFFGNDDQVLSAFKKADELGSDYTKNLTHMRDINPKLVQIIKEQRKFIRSTQAMAIGIFETFGPEAILASANSVLLFDDIDMIEIQLAASPMVKSLFVIAGQSDIIEKAFDSAKVICQSTHFSIPGWVQSPDWRSS